MVHPGPSAVVLGGRAFVLQNIHAIFTHGLSCVWYNKYDGAGGRFSAFLCTPRGCRGGPSPPQPLDRSRRVCVGNVCPGGLSWQM